MSWQLNCASAEPKANRYGSSMPVLTAKLHLRGREADLGRERWSG
jgi:hypothetical protein